MNNNSFQKFQSTAQTAFYFVMILGVVIGLILNYAYIKSDVDANQRSIERNTAQVAYITAEVGVVSKDLAALKAQITAIEQNTNRILNKMDK